MASTQGASGRQHGAGGVHAMRIGVLAFRFALLPAEWYRRTCRGPHPQRTDTAL